MYKAVIFDLDNTLYDYDACHAQAWEALCCYAKEHLGMEREKFIRCREENIDALESRLGMPCAAIHNRILRYQGIMEKYGFPLIHCLKMSDLYWDTFFRYLVPAPGVEECLAALKEKKFCLGIGTNMTVDYQLRKLEALGLLKYFDFLVTSEEVLAEKPAGKFFACCAEKAGALPEECVFVGDDLQKDVMGARNAGMTAVWFCSNEAPTDGQLQCRRITHYDQLRRWLIGTENGCHLVSERSQ